MKEMEFCFTHGTFQANQKSIIKIRHIVDTAHVDHKVVELPAKFKELYEIGGRPGKV